MGTSNPTLTLAALALRTAERLEDGASPDERRTAAGAARGRGQAGARRPSRRTSARSTRSTRAPTTRRSWSSARSWSRRCCTWSWPPTCSTRSAAEPRVSRTRARAALPARAARRRHHRPAAVLPGGGRELPEGGEPGVHRPTQQAAEARARPPARRCTSSTPSRVLRRGPRTIGAFYAEIVAGLKEVAAEIGEEALFCGDPARQVSGDYYYAGGGAPIVVTDLDVGLPGARGDRRAGRGRHGLDVRRRRRPRALLPLRAAQVRPQPTSPATTSAHPTGAAGGGRLRRRLPDARQPEQPDEYTDPDLRAAVGRGQPRRGRCCCSRSTRRSTGTRPRSSPPCTPCSGCATPMLVLLANPMPGHHGCHAGPTFEWADRPGTDDAHPLDSEGRIVIFPIGATRRTQHQTRRTPSTTRSSSAPASAARSSPTS